MEAQEVPGRNGVSRRHRTVIGGLFPNQQSLALSWGQVVAAALRIEIARVLIALKLNRTL